MKAKKTTRKRATRKRTISKRSAPKPTGRRGDVLVLRDSKGFPAITLSAAVDDMPQIEIRRRDGSTVVLGFVDWGCHLELRTKGNKPAISIGANEKAAGVTVMDERERALARFGHNRRTRKVGLVIEGGPSVEKDT